MKSPPRAWISSADVVPSVRRRSVESEGAAIRSTVARSLPSTIDPRISKPGALRSDADAEREVVAVLARRAACDAPDPHPAITTAHPNHHPPRTRATITRRLAHH